MMGRRPKLQLLDYAKEKLPPADPPTRPKPQRPTGDEYQGDHVHGPVAARTEPSFERGDSYEGTGAGKKPKASRFTFIPSNDFDGADYKAQWWIPKVLVRNQPGIIAGPSKTLKTSLLIDAAVSLAAARPFLGTFDVPTRARVAVVSGESGLATLQETARRVCASKGVSLADLGDRLVWCDTLPTFADLAAMVEFADSLSALGVEVAIIDPLYLALGPIDAKNMFEMGAALRVVADVLLKAGCTPILVHHANRQLAVGEAMELHHIAYAGLEQFARQFVLLNRRESYQSDGRHDLWVRVGGSAGHGGLWAVHVDEGVTDENFAGRTWSVTVQGIGEVHADQIAERENRKRDTARKQAQKEEAEVLVAIDAELRSGQPAATQASVKRRCPHLSGAKAKDILARLIDATALEEVEFVKAGGHGSKQTVTGYRRVQKGNGWNAGIPTDLFPPIRDGEER